MGIVEALLDPVPAGARPGQLSRVTLETAAAERIMIPFQTLQRDTQGEYVYRVDADNRVHCAGVQSGIRVADRVEITQGLEANTRILVKGLLGLKKR